MPGHQSADHIVPPLSSVKHFRQVFQNHEAARYLSKTCEATTWINSRPTYPIYLHVQVQVQVQVHNSGQYLGCIHGLSHSPQRHRQCKARQGRAS